jgi:energy-converting hydrogenase Eha subunit H
LRPASLDAAGALAVRGEAAIVLAPATLEAAGTVTVHGEAAIVMAPATVFAEGMVLAGLIGERETLTGARAPVVELVGSPSAVAIAGTRARAVALTGSSDMVRV